MWSTQLFDPGRVVVTPGVGALLDQFDGPTQMRLVIRLLIRHIGGDWGEVDSDDQAANDHAVIQGERLLSAYRLPDSTKVWVILVTATYSGLPYGGIRWGALATPRNEVLLSRRRSAEPVPTVQRGCAKSTAGVIISPDTSARRAP